MIPYVSSILHSLSINLQNLTVSVNIVRLYRFHQFSVGGFVMILNNETWKARLIKNILESNPSVLKDVMDLYQRYGVQAMEELIKTYKEREAKTAEERRRNNETLCCPYCGCTDLMGDGPLTRCYECKKGF